jgi:MSHA biogenesis protein MshE
MNLRMALAKRTNNHLEDLLVEHKPLLVENKLITPEQLQIAVDIQKSSGKDLGRVLIENGYISEEALFQFWAQQLNVDYIDLKHRDIKPDIVKLIPESKARRFRVIAIDQDGSGLQLGMADPTDIFAFDEINAMLQRPLKAVLVKEDDLVKAIDTMYRRSAEISGLVAELQHQIAASEKIAHPRRSAETSSDAPVVKLLQTILEDAIQVNASDVHIEPGQNDLMLRFRIDGMLRTQTTADRSIANPLLSRLKLMAHLDIAERRLPQDGRFNIVIHDKNIDVRVSTMPLETGEAAVLRLLNQSAGILDLNQVGMPQTTLDKLRQVMRSPHGLVLVAGPTGSGKTTTLYAMLKELNNPSVKIITAEDPVEYRLPGISQVQINPKVDLSFARILRAILRHDPDIVLIGEMRDSETAQIGLRAAMTGHFVLSTLHTNDAISTVLRLIDMEAEPYLIAGALRGILAQRLVRRVCDNCATTDDLEPNTRIFFERELASEGEAVFKKGTGCTYCNQTGYLGRIGVYEYLAITPELAELLHQGEVMQFSRQAAQQDGYQNLKQSAFQLAAKGLTTLDEVMRVSFGMDE